MLYEGTWSTELTAFEMLKHIRSLKRWCPTAPPRALMDQTRHQPRCIHNPCEGASVTLACSGAHPYSVPASPPCGKQRSLPSQVVLVSTKASRRTWSDHRSKPSQPGGSPGLVSWPLISISLRDLAAVGRVVSCSGRSLSDVEALSRKGENI